VLSGIGAEHKHSMKQRKVERKIRIVSSLEDQEKQCNDNVPLNLVV
jgi:hypothetical protein